MMCTGPVLGRLMIQSVMLVPKLGEDSFASNSRIQHYRYEDCVEPWEPNIARKPDSPYHQDSHLSRTSAKVPNRAMIRLSKPNININVSASY